MKDSDTRNEWEDAGPRGVGGWLILLIATLWLMAIFRGGVGAARLAAMRFASGAEGHAGLLTGIAEVLAAILASTAAFLLMRRNPAAPLVSKIFFFANAVYYLGLVVVALRGSSPYLADAIPTWVIPAGSLAGSIACILYLSNSQRVANTYADTARKSRSDVEELSVVPRTRARPWDGWKDDTESDEQLSMRREPTTAEVEARLLNSVRARIGERPRPQDETRPGARASDEPRHQDPPAGEHSPAAEESRPAIAEPTAVAQARPGITDQPKTPVEDLVASYAELAADLQPETPPVPHASESEEVEPEELNLLKDRITDGLIDWLRNADNSIPGTGSGIDEEKVRAKLLRQVQEICDHVWGVHVGRFATLPNTPDSGGSLATELQKWAVAQAALRLTRSLDIRAAMQVKGPFAKMAQDREYLMAIAQKNAWDEGFAWSAAVAEFEGCSGPEIACTLIQKAQRDLAEARMWAQVARLAGDPDFLKRFEEAGSKAFQESVQYWRARVIDTNGNVSRPPAASGATKDDSAAHPLGTAH